MSDRRTLFPSQPGGLSLSLSDDPVLIDGMKVAFDTKVALYPVTLKPGDDAPRSRDGADEEDDGAA